LLFVEVILSSFRIKKIRSATGAAKVGQLERFKELFFPMRDSTTVNHDIFEIGKSGWTFGKVPVRCPARAPHNCTCSSPPAVAFFGVATDGQLESFMMVKIFFFNFDAFKSQRKSIFHFHHSKDDYLYLRIRMIEGKR
jgi:hypothetical protein